MKNKALVADTDSSASVLVKCVLRGLGWEVQTVSSATAARVAFARGNHDLLVADVHLGGWFGIDLAEGCLALKPSLRVVMMSGEADHLRHAHKAGFTRAIRKPFDLAALRHAAQPTWSLQPVLPGRAAPAKAATAAGRPWRLGALLETQETIHVQPSPAC